MIILLLVSAMAVRWSSATSPGTDGRLTNVEVRQKLEMEAKIYLDRFGYIVPTIKNGEQVEPSASDLQTAIARFQREFLFYPSGTIDVPTISKLTEYRCANRDMYRGQTLTDLPNSELWKKKTLTWHLDSYPQMLGIQEVRQSCIEAFAKWQEVTQFTFVEAINPSSSDIRIAFGDLPNNFMNVAGAASRPLEGQILMDKSRLWGFREHIPEGLSLFHSLLHEIGHTIGLHHTFYRNSIMYPIFKPALVPYGTLQSVPNVDILAYRKLYGLSQSSNENEISNDGATRQKCPKFLNSIVDISPNDDWLLFQNSKAIHIKDRKVVDSGRPIDQVFPRGPQFVNATVYVHDMCLLFSDRTIYGYQYRNGQFVQAPDFPRQLHSRVLFYPDAAFPLSNGSIILLSGNVFATYDVIENAPSYIEDKTVYYPNLPYDIRSGIPIDDVNYWMFDDNTVSHYNINTKESSQLKSLQEFIKC